MRLGFGVALLLVAALPVSALADQIVSVNLTGIQNDGVSPLTSTFTLNANSFATDGFTYTFTDPNATLNGAPDPLTVTLSQSVDGNTLELSDGSYLEDFDFLANGSTAFFDPSGPSFNAGTYMGLDFSNFNDAQLTATTVTPEPGSFALFGTGLLGVCGMVRRRYFAA